MLFQVPKFGSPPIALDTPPVKIFIKLFELLAGLLEERGEFVVVLGCLVIARHKEQFWTTATT